MVVRCEEVWSQVSNYLEGDLDSGARAAVEEHLRECKRCEAVVAGTRNVIKVYGDERLFEAPAGFSQRLHRRLEAEMPRRRGPAFGWMMAFAAAAMLIVGFEVGNSPAFSRPQLRSEHAQPAERTIPANLVVVVTDGSKLFHLPTCGMIHNKATEKTLTAEEAERQGYVPCVRCLRRYVNVSAGENKQFSHESSGKETQQVGESGDKLTVSLMYEKSKLGEQGISHAKLSDSESGEGELAEAKETASEL